MLMIVTNIGVELIGADCSVTVNGATLQEVEAFLWAVDQINQHDHLLPATTLGALVLDTCGSRVCWVYHFQYYVTMFLKSVCV